MRILVSGASGFIGKPLTFYLTSQGHAIVPLSRSPQKKADAITWDPGTGRAKPQDFEGFDAVIHLAGEPIQIGRWTQKVKNRILYSRTASTFFLSHILSTLLHPPQIFISASACGYYGDRGEEVLTEESQIGRGFLPHVCCEWEKAAMEMKERGIRLVHTRFGVVIGPNGGMLQKILFPYKLGLGGKLGSGEQWMSWIALEDLVRSMDHILSSDIIEGPVNLVSPNPVRQKDFSKTLAHLIHRPSFFSIPAWALRLVLGQMANEMLLASARVSPMKLLASNFSFHYPDLQGALHKAL